MTFWPFPRRVALPAIEPVQILHELPAPRRASTTLSAAYQDRRRREIAKALGKFQTTGSES